MTSIEKYENSDFLLEHKPGRYDLELIFYQPVTVSRELITEILNTSRFSFMSVYGNKKGEAVIVMNSHCYHN